MVSCPVLPWSEHHCAMKYMGMSCSIHECQDQGVVAKWSKLFTSTASSCNLVADSYECYTHNLSSCSKSASSRRQAQPNNRPRFWSRNVRHGLVVFTRFISGSWKRERTVLLLMLEVIALNSKQFTHHPWHSLLKVWGHIYGLIFGAETCPVHLIIVTQ